jgi:hypothetical protein
MGIGSQGKKWKIFDGPKMIGSVPASHLENLPALLHE